MRVRRLQASAGLTGGTGGIIEAALLIVSEGEPRAYADVVEAAERLGFSGGGVLLMLWGDPRLAFRVLTTAAALVVAKSTFSYAAGLLSTGVV